MAKLKMPSAESIAVAIEWLRINEGYEDGGVIGNEGSERDACHAVADWLQQQDDARELRGVARENGVTVVLVKRALANAQSKS